MSFKRKFHLFLLVLFVLIILGYNIYIIYLDNAYSESSQRVRIFYFFVYIFFLSLFYAKLEIEIEGEHGWAQNLPTWVYKPKWIISLMNGKYPTGYHTFSFALFIPAIFHFPIFFADWNLSREFVVLGAFFLFLVMEDFLWFSLNPKFSIKNFNSKNKKIWWHKKWFGPLPEFYLESLVIAFIFLSLGLPNF